MDRAKIILIGGVPGVGKTSISGYVASRLGINIVLSGDYLREFLRAYSFEDNDPLKYSVYDSWKDFGPMNEDNIIRGYLKQGNLLWKGLHRVISRAIDNGESMIIELLYFLPQFIRDFSSKDLLPLYLYLSDEKLHANRLNEREEFTHYNSPGSRLVSHLFEYRVIMTYTLRNLKDAGIIAYDNLDYHRTRDEILDKVGDFTGHIPDR
jgi:mevalonate-3-phosphate-5-kinase